MKTVSDSSQVRTPQNAETPYDATALSNIILRSSDFIDFYVLRDFLRYVSPFFVDMFDLPAAGKNEKKGGLPIIPVAETSETLRHLLDFIHPHDCEPQLDNVTLFLNVCKATQKYCMKNIENKLRKRIVTSHPHLISTEPLRLYAVAIDLGWEDVALIAAQKASEIPLNRLAHAKELSNISGSGFYRFLEYTLRCEKARPGDTTIALSQLTTLSKAATRSGVSSPLIPGTPDPFGPTANANIILRSSDCVAFFVTGDIIRMASSTLSNLYDTATARGESSIEGEGRTIINVADDSKVLFHLLCLIHPILAELDIQNCQLFIQVVLAARRLGVTVVETRLRKQAAASPLLLTEPLRMYVVASALGWDDIAKSAALNTFFHPLQEMAYMEEFDFITGTDLYRLVAFRFKCADAACDVITSNSDHKAYGPGRWDYKLNVVEHCGSTEQLFEKLRSCPRGSTIADAYDLQDKVLEGNNARGYYLRCATLPEVLKCRRELATAVESAVSQVPLAV